MSIRRLPEAGHRGGVADFRRFNSGSKIINLRQFLCEKVSDAVPFSQLRAFDELDGLQVFRLEVLRAVYYADVRKAT